MRVKLTRFTSAPVEAIEEASSNCYDSKPTADGKIMNECYKSGHHSVLEFVNFTFHIEGVSRSLLAQLTRHRHAGYAVRSQRYCDSSKDDFVIPHTIENNAVAKAFYEDCLKQIKRTYKNLQAFGIPNEDARYILPNACETTLEFTCNLRELIHFMNERLCSRAQWEIRELANRMRNCLINTEGCENFVKFLVPKCDAGQIKYCPERKSCGRRPKAEDIIGQVNKH